jgi:DNA replication protein DnaC
MEGIMREDATLPILLKELRLKSMQSLWEGASRTAIEENWLHSRYLAYLCENEMNDRYQKRIALHMKQAQLPYGKSLATYRFECTPSLNKARVQDLAENTQWVKDHGNVLIFGPSGVGKTHLASAIGLSLIEKGIRVFFTKTTTLVQKLQLARKELQLPQALGKLDLYQVLILDDIGYVRKDDAETHVLFELIAHRYETGSMMITSNQAFSEWDSIFANSAMTVAAIDRLVHHATILEVVAESYRKAGYAGEMQNKSEEIIQEQIAA